MKQIIKTVKSNGNSIYVKIIFIFLLMTILMIPNGLISGLIYERSNLKSTAEADIAGTWGESQFISGPCLSFPVKEKVLNNLNEIQTISTNINLMPESLNIKSDVKHEIRKRGIYEVILYINQLEVSGKFDLNKVRKEFGDEIEINWNNIILNIGIQDSHGIGAVSPLQFNGKEYELMPGILETKTLSKGIHSKLSIGEDQNIVEFSFTLDLKGSSSMSFEPVAKATKIEMRSDWISPSFYGSTLPSTREITKEGFSAVWETSQFNRDYPNIWKGDKYRLDKEYNKMGVRFIQTVDLYQKNTRTNKYALLIIGLTFFIFFFFENLMHNQIHPIQYAMVGFALSIFYLLLLALTEHIGFSVSYLVSAIAVISLIIYYCAAILNQKKSLIFLTISLIVLYIYIYVILQLEDVALLAGSIGLFVILAIIMGLSRKVDWYNLTAKEEE